MNDSKNSQNETQDFWMQKELIQKVHDDMLRFTKLQIHEKSLAEDLVQEAFSSAYENKHKFKGNAQFKTWIFTILKNKIIDYFRHHNKFNTTSFDHESDELVDALFKPNGHWKQDQSPDDWGQPDKVLDNHQFWQVFDICMNDMKDNLAQIFSMRELLGLKTSEICEELAISESNCWVLLHRARSNLRLCLESRWFDQ